MTCPFCSQVAASDGNSANEFAIAIPDGFPLSRGHTLIVSRAHEPDFLRLPEPTREAMWRLAHHVCEILRHAHSPDGFNLGVNIGEAGGQTVPHAHIHVIPRYAADVEDPRGGVRWVLPAGARYW